MGIVADLTDKFNEWEDKDALSDSVVNAMTIDNKVIGIPYEMTVRAYLVHDDDLRKLQVSKLLQHGKIYSKLRLL